MPGQSDTPPQGFRNIAFKPTLLVDQLVPFFIEAILGGDIKGGDQLIENELQKQLGISRSPLREAFRELEKRGLVVIVPRKGTFVKAITRKDIEETIPVRAILEGLAAKEAYKRMTKEDVQKAKNILETMGKSFQKKDHRSYWEKHVLFHDVFIHASSNDVLISILQPLRTKTLWYTFSLHYHKEDLRGSFEAHRKIWKLYHRKEATPEQVETCVRNHVENFLNKFTKYLGD